VATYLVERTVPGGRHLGDVQRALAESCRRLSDRGQAVSYLGGWLVEATGRCLWLFEAASSETVLAASQAAQLPFARVELVVELHPPEPG
jgi:hypothetical protein